MSASTFHLVLYIMALLSFHVISLCGPTRLCDQRDEHGRRRRSLLRWDGSSRAQSSMKYRLDWLRMDTLLIC